MPRGLPFLLFAAYLSVTTGFQGVAGLMTARSVASTTTGSHLGRGLRPGTVLAAILLASPDGRTSPDWIASCTPVAQAPRRVGANRLDCRV